LYAGKITRKKLGKIMGVRLETIKAVGHVRADRLKIILEGQHTMEEKICMAMKAVAVLEHDHGIYRASDCDWWVSPIDDHNHPLTIFPGGQLVGKSRLIVDSPYSCAAKAYGL
jgi:hypothetical protein